MWTCRLCGQKIGLFEKHGRLRTGEQYKYIHKDPRTLRKKVLTGTIGPHGAVQAGRVCLKCHRNWLAAHREAEAEQARRDQRANRQQQAPARPRRRETVRSRTWVLDNMPIAGNDTLARYARSLRRTSRTEILSLGRGKQLVGVRDYRRGNDEAIFTAFDDSTAFEWVIVRTGTDTWAIADTRQTFTG